MLEILILMYGSPWTTFFFMLGIATILSSFFPDKKIINNHSTMVTNSKVILNGQSTREEYNALFLLKAGDVFKISSEYETVLERIEELHGDDFQVFPINPGTDLFTIYGDSHLVVTKNNLL